jgi:predicted acylesterase/phospholipase RssA
VLPHQEPECAAPVGDPIVELEIAPRDGDATTDRPQVLFGRDRPRGNVLCYLARKRRPRLKTARILSIDGGGVRGVIPARLLAELERRTGRPVSALFDVVAGTSTGGVIALALTAAAPDSKPRYRAAEVVELFERESSRIFHRGALHFLDAVGNLRHEKYDDAGARQVLTQYLGEARLKDALTDVLITSYEIRKRTPFLFRSRHARSRSDYDFPIVEVARATIAAPTYFEPHHLHADEEQGYALVDGGVFANNPAMCAFLEARVTLRDADDFLLVSLGTGALSRSYSWSQARAWGLLEWAKPLFDILLAGTSETVDFQLRELLPAVGGAPRYHRFQPRLEHGHEDLDNSTATNLADLMTLTESFIADRDREIDALCSQLTALE